MPTRIYKVNGIIITIAIQIKSIYGFCIEVSCIIRRNKPTPFGGVVSRVEEVPTCFGVEIIASISNSIIHCEKSVVNNQIAAYVSLAILKNRLIFPYPVAYILAKKLGGK